MARLTNAIKDQIARNAVEKAGIISSRERLISERQDWINRVRLQAIGGEVVERQMLNLEKRLAKQLEKFDSTVFQSGDFKFKRKCSLVLNIAWQKVWQDFSGGIDNWSCCAESQWLISPYKATLLADDPLTKEWEASEKAVRELDEEFESLCASIRGTLSAFNTIKQLLDAWPEAEELLPAAAEKPASTLPAVQTEKLNSMIGLPTDIQEAA